MFMLHCSTYNTFKLTKSFKLKYFNSAVYNASDGTDRWSIFEYLLLIDELKVININLTICTNEQIYFSSSRNGYKAFEVSH